MKELGSKIKNFFDKAGVRRVDLWAIVTMIISVVGILVGNIGIVGVALFPAFLTGYFLACDSWDDEDGPEDEDETASPDPDYQLYA